MSLMKIVAVFCKLINPFYCEGKTNLFCNSSYETEAYGTCPPEMHKASRHSVLSLSHSEMDFVDMGAGREE